VKETAYAKINLALHVRHRREDGYHELETLFAFVDAGDELVAQQAEQDRFSIFGEFAADLSFTDNLVLEALNSMRKKPFGSVPPLSVELYKELPVAAGLGGGSADAGAMIRLLDRVYVRNGDARELVLANKHLGADVAACIVSRTRIGRGTGAELEMVDDDLAGTPVLLVNPRVPLSTGPVFKAWDGKDRGPLPTGSTREIALTGRNDLRAPAISLCPVIADVLEALEATRPWKAEMSGSGATCFALYDSEAARDAAAAAMPAQWWKLCGKLR
jgi:4-diphosphocytidyl-2-C-methyl-D-erythritol kinase